jgi:hypothetical protein
MSEVTLKQHKALVAMLALVVAAAVGAAAGCSGDGTAFPGTGGNGAVGGSDGGAATSAGGTASTGGNGGSGGMGNAGGLGGEAPQGPLPAAGELNSAHGHMSGPTFTMQFQLGRSFHQAPATAGDITLECAAPTN